MPSILMTSSTKSYFSLVLKDSGRRSMALKRRDLRTVAVSRWRSGMVSNL
jgi:hypothetical protein